MIWHARAKGYKVGCVYFRTADEIPITSSKMNCFGNWEDFKTVLEYVHGKYVLDAETGEKQTRLYAYGCSLGANHLGLYLVNEGERATAILDGACLYSTPWNTRDNEEYFFKSMHGLCQRAVGLNLNRELRRKVLPKMKPYLSAEEYEAYAHALATNKTGLDHLNQHIF